MLIALIAIVLAVHVLAYALCRTAAEADRALEGGDDDATNNC